MALLLTHFIGSAALLVASFLSMQTKRVQSSTPKPLNLASRHAFPSADPQERFLYVVADLKINQSCLAAWNFAPWATNLPRPQTTPSADSVRPIDTKQLLW